MRAWRYADARETRSAVSRGAPPAVQACLAAMTAREGAGTEDLSGGLLLSGACWHGVLCLQDDARCLVSPHGPPQRFAHLLAPEVGRGDHPSGRACRDSADA